MSDNELYDAAAELFGAHSHDDQKLWNALQHAGFSDVPVPEALGGAGGSVADAVQLLRAAGAHAAPVPLAEAGLVGGWLLASAGLALPQGVRTVLPPDAPLRLDDDRLFGTAPAVAWGHRAEHVIGLINGVVVLAPGPAAVGGPAASRGVNLADEPRDTLVFDGVPVTARADAPDEITEQTLWERTVLGRAALMAGAVSAVAAMTLRYSREREQFGRPIGRFQAVQAHLVTLHQQAAVVASAVDGAVEAVELGRGGFEIACAKMLADRAAQLVTAAAHQTHGAIGMTKEYPLHYLTRRLWAWRDEAGGHNRWADRLGAALVDRGPDALYPAIQSGSEIVQWTD
ncbi:acyl-CoA dehydrogenase [Mycobacterium sp. MFM001]|uniref:acyl-CoA dehydrogenase family protein n=1 Tax=Mycobacterium sp. MFM001 TaxID=2049453 RepID=UPI000DA577B3|nr:acyl-CoA dehydrogenase family protein [Mycobacterium sp. MFM001]GBE66236.1 acyl-CoA dehydrogenase [Mycobacterium sp. MFM001]